MLGSRSQHGMYFVLFEGDVIVYLFLKGRGRRLSKAEKSWFIRRRGVSLFWSSSFFFLLPNRLLRHAMD